MTEEADDFSMEGLENCFESDRRMTALSSHIYEDVDVGDPPDGDHTNEEQTPTLDEPSKRTSDSSEVTITVTADCQDEDDDDCDPTNEMADYSGPQKAFYANLPDRTAELEEQNAELLAELEELREDYEAEKEKRTTCFKQNENLKVELKQTQQALQQYTDALERLSSASEAAFREFEQLKGSYAKEIVCRDKAEKYAATLFAEREAARRQSSMLLMNVAGDRKLMEAMVEVETLTTQVEEQKALHERQIRELQEEVQSLREREAVSSLEEENHQLTEQVYSLQAQLTAQHDQYSVLLSQYESLEKKLEEATRPPPPPPPPPPPEPKGRLSKIFKGKKSKKEIIKQSVESSGKGSAVTPGYSQALEEMMKRIKTGTPLRPAARTPKTAAGQDEATREPGMLELKEILGKMKKITPAVGSSSQAGSAERQADSELAKAFKKLQKTSSSDQEGENGVKQEHSKASEVPEATSSPQSEGAVMDVPADSRRQGPSKPVPRQRGSRCASAVSDSQNPAAEQRRLPHTPE